jgi:hypothetical protein
MVGIGLDLPEKFPLVLKLSSSSEETRVGLAVNYLEVVHSGGER